jgi:chaperonin GroEL
MNPKELHFAEEGREKLFSGLEKITNAVKSTLGPRGNTVLIESENHTRGITVTKDGVTVAKSISLLDAVENLAVRIVKEASEKTATNAGDGTTTAIVLSQALSLAGNEMITSGMNKTLVLRELVEATKVVVENLRKMSKPVDKNKLEDVATISANNDSYIGNIISNVFINNHKKDECIYEDVNILVSDAEITNVLQIENILKPIINKGEKLLIIANASSNVLNTLAANVMKNGLKICVISPPSFGYKQHELMNDIALSVGATYFSEKTGDDLSLILPKDLGKAKKIIVGKDSTIIIKDEDAVSKDDIDKRVSELREAHDITDKKADREFILSRIASLTGGVGVIYAGGKTDLEQKELYDRIDDAVCAVRSATVEGILPGGGLALENISRKLVIKDNWSDEKKCAYEILKVSLLSPIVTILENAGLNYNSIYSDDFSKGWGYDVKNDKYGNMMKMGVIDPMKVTKNALQNAVSVAVTLLSTNAIITMMRDNGK